jgi:hypothetical protein
LIHAGILHAKNNLNPKAEHFISKTGYSAENPMQKKDSALH